MQPPKVFISHASEDKERFILGFYERLLEKGIDAWLDKNEILLGDNIVDKVFEEGIKNSKVVIVVLSPFSVNKPWPKLERDVSVIKKLNEEIRIIPILIDLNKSQVPESLKPYRWIEIKKMSDYETELNEIVNSIYEHREKPPLGEPPPYAQMDIEALSQLTPIDCIILKIACERFIEQGYIDFIEGEEMLNLIAPFGIKEDPLWESLQVLDRRGYIDLHQNMGFDHERLKVVYFTITDHGFETYLKNYYGNYSETLKILLSQIVNYDECRSHSLADSLHISQPIVDHILKTLANKHLIDIYEPASGEIYIVDVNPDLKRML